MSGVMVTSLYGHDTREPLVHVRLDDGKSEFQCSPEEARAFALNLLSAAEAAESDAFVFEFGAQRLGLPEEAGTMLLVEFRNWRQKAEKEAKP